MKINHIKAKTIKCPGCRGKMQTVEAVCSNGKKQVIGFNCNCGLKQEVPDDYMNVCGFVSENQQELL